ncbi:MAG TPA: DUF418 domain-containing protein [Sphingomicrobium sp.]
MSFALTDKDFGLHRPIRQRAAHIDSMRALALLGVIVMNIGSMVMMVNGREVFAAASTFDIGLAGFNLLFVLGKARSCFAFLFGAGFAILMMRAEARGGGFAPLYGRRMGALLLFGLVNQVFLFWGDILVTYALLGFALMLVGRWTNAAMLKAGLALTLAPPLLAGLTEALLGHPIPDLLDLPRQAEAARAMAAFTSPSYLDAVTQYIWMGSTRHAASTAHMAIYDLSVFGLFLLGAWSVRTGVLTDPQHHRPLLRRIIKWCLPAGLVLSAVNAAPFLGMRPEGLAAAGITAAYIGVPVLAFAYLAAFALLFSKGHSAVQSFLAPAGRMSLTNYLLSGALGCWVFYGFGLGLLREFDMVEITLFGIGLFIALAVLSRLWLAAFPYGPAEWLWRRLSYGRRISAPAGPHPATV